MDDYDMVTERLKLETVDRSCEGDVDVSVVIVIRDPQRAAPMPDLYQEYRRQLEDTGLQYEFIFVLEGNQEKTLEDLRLLKEGGKPIRILVLSRWYGGATALSAGFDYASGRFILKLPAYFQIDPDAIPSLLPALETSHMVVVRRWPRRDGLLTRLQVRGFHAILRRILGFNFSDLGCSVVAFRTEILNLVDIYGDQHRFLPVLASHHGFKVKEVEVPQASQDTFRKGRSFGAVLNRLFDLLAIFFLTTYTKKPLRFFGFAGMLAFLGGTAITGYLTFQRLFMGVPLADKPMLLAGLLLIVLGTLFLAIGLIGEMIIFSHSRKLKEYTVEEVVN